MEIGIIDSLDAETPYDLDSLLSIQACGGPATCDGAWERSQGVNTQMRRLGLEEGLERLDEADSSFLFIMTDGAQINL
jgi:hypothetical protein